MIKTFSAENKAQHIMIGKKFTGDVILPSKTIYVDKADNYAIKKFSDLPVRDRKKFEQKSRWGMHHVGFPFIYSIHERNQQWLEWESLLSGDRKIRLRNESTPFLICKPFEYVMVCIEVEDANKVPLNVFFTVTLMPTNALLPVFGNDHAYGQVQTKCISQVLLYVKIKTFTNLGGDNATNNPIPQVTNDEFSVLLQNLNDQIPGSPVGEGIIKVLGYKITDAKLDKVEIAGPNKQKILDASVLEYIALETQKAEIAKAEGEKRAEILRSEGREVMYNVQKNYLIEISKLPGAMEVEKRRVTPPGVTTLVEGKTKTNMSLN